MSDEREYTDLHPYTSEELFNVDIDNLFRYLFKIALDRDTTEDEKKAYDKFKRGFETTYFGLDLETMKLGYILPKRSPARFKITAVDAMYTLYTELKLDSNKRQKVNDNLFLRGENKNYDIYVIS